MPLYVAFLRAVNVGGRTIRMERLRGIFTTSGFANVETFIASGNVIFESRGTNISILEARIETALETALGYPVAAFVRRADALAPIAGHQPFPLDASGAPGGTIHIGFLRSPASAAARQRMLSFRTDVDDFDVRGQEFYWLIRGSFKDSKLTGNAIERTLGQTTLRNRNTIVRLATKFGT